MSGAWALLQAFQERIELRSSRTICSPQGT